MAYEIDYMHCDNLARQKLIRELCGRKREMMDGEDGEGRKRRGKEGKEDHFVKVPGPAGTLGQLFRFQLERQGI